MTPTAAVHAICSEWPDDATMADVCRCETLTFVNSARASLDRYAASTDSPDWRLVEVADLLDATRALLTGEVSP